MQFSRLTKVVFSSLWHEQNEFAHPRPSEKMSNSDIDDPESSAKLDEKGEDSCDIDNFASTPGHEESLFVEQKHRRESRRMITKVIQNKDADTNYRNQSKRRKVIDLKTDEANDSNSLDLKSKQ